MVHGRGQELARLERLLEAVRAGAHRVAIIDGEAGIGKSTLLEETVEAARARGFQIYTGAAEPGERDRPFATAARTFAVQPELDGLLITTGSSRWVDPMVDIGFRAVDAIVDIVRRRAGDGPVMVAVDDVHWADRQSVTALAAIHRKLDGLPIALVLTLRPGEGLAHCDELVARLSGCRSIQLGPLSEEEIATLAGELAGAPPAPGLRTQLAKLGGNPFFAGELIRALTEEGALEVTNDVAESATATVPPALVRIVLWRLNVLPEPTVELLRLASVLGPSFPVADLALVSGRPAVDVAALLAPRCRTWTCSLIPRH